MAAKHVFLLIAHTTFREAVACVVDEESDLEVVSQVGSLAEMGNNNLEHNIDVALVDLSLSDGDGMAAIRKLSMEYGDAVALALSGGSDLAITERALEAGAARVLATSSSFGEVVDAIRNSVHEEK